MRPSGRKTDQMRKVSFERNISKHAEGSCLVKFGDTHVLVTASLEEKTPPWLRNSGKGWVTAEYGMLPRATGERMKREAASRQAERPHPGNPAPDRPFAACSRRSEGTRRTPDLDRLRRHPGRWRHPDRLDHRRLDCAARLPRLDGSPQHDQGREGPEGPYRRDLLRHLRQPAGDRPRLPGGLGSGNRRQFRHDRLGRASSRSRAPPKASRSRRKNSARCSALAKNGISELVTMQKQAIGG